MAVLHAHSPQAKGRVERLFHTFQDRLVKEMRLAAISTLDEANRFLAGYLPRYNRRFTVPPAQPTDLHRPRPTSRDLDRSLCLKTTRVVRRDWTVAYEGCLYQIHDAIRAIQVQVEERLDGTLRITHQGRPLRFQAIAARPTPTAQQAPGSRPRRPVPPRPDHPWRKRLLPERSPQAAAGT